MRSTTWRNPKTGEILTLPKGRFLDPRTLAWAITNTSYSLKSLAEHLKKIGYDVPQKFDDPPSGRVTLDEIRYCRQDVRVTIGCLNALRIEFDKHPISLLPDRAYSPASIAKSYLKQMGIALPSKKFKLPKYVTGVSTQAYSGGRSESRIKNTVAPVYLYDAKSEYPTVNANLGLWKFLIAKRLRIKSATKEVRELLESLTLDDLFDKELWRKFTVYALVDPAGDILPYRTLYDKEPNVGLNIVEKSDEPLWYALPELIASKIQTGKAPKVIRAIRLVPEGTQKGLREIAIRGDKKSVVDPRVHDFFQSIVDFRDRVKADKSLADSEREGLQYFLKILANAGSYGLFIETTPKDVWRRKKIKVYSGEHHFQKSSSFVEEKGPFYFPVIASLITSAGRLLLAMIEKSVADAGGVIAAMDTDSAFIVASKEGGYIPCVGGAHRLPDGREAVKVLSQSEVDMIVARFQQLNPYKSNVPILKLEKQCWCYAISAKRYVLFEWRGGDRFRVLKASSHGLGHLYFPKSLKPQSEFDEDVQAPVWVREAWEYILRKQVFGVRASRPRWFDIPAMRKLVITTPRVQEYKIIAKQQKELPYRDRVKPFNFLLAPEIFNPVHCPPEAALPVMIGYPHKLDGKGQPKLTVDPERFRLIAQFSDDPSEWRNLTYTNSFNGKTFRMGSRSRRNPSDFVPFCLGDIVEMHSFHAEAKSLAPDGTPCEGSTKGLLLRTPVIKEGLPHFHGKETNRAIVDSDEDEIDIALFSHALPDYQPGETERISANAILRLKARNAGVSTRRLAKKTGLSTRTVRLFLNGKQTRKTTQAIISKALEKIKSEQPQ